MHRIVCSLLFLHDRHFCVKCSVERLISFFELTSKVDSLERETISLKAKLCVPMPCDATMSAAGATAEALSQYYRCRRI